MAGRKKRAARPKSSKSPSAKSDPVKRAARTTKGAHGGGSIQQGGQRGNPYFLRQRELRERIDAAITIEQKVAVIKAMGVHAVKGDAAAGKVFLDQVVGKPPRPPRWEDLYPEASASIEIPEVKRPEDVADAVRVIRNAHLAGRIDVAQMNALMNTVHLEFAAIHAVEVDRRLEALEAEAGGDRGGE